MGKYFRNSIISISKLQDDSASSLVRSGECKGCFLQVYNLTFIQYWTLSHRLSCGNKILETLVIKERVLYFQLVGSSSMQILVPGDVRFVKNLQIAEAWNFNKLVKNV